MLLNLSIELEKASDTELHSLTVAVAQKEQQTTLSLLYHLHEIERRKVFASLGFSSLWEYVVKALGYSESQTFERISAMRLMFRVREARVSLETGKLTLTQAAMTERCLRTEEKEKKTPVSKEVVQTLLKQVEGKSKRETEKILLSYQPKVEERTERIRQVSEEISEIRFSASEGTRQAMERFWELKGKCSVAELLSTCLEFYLNEKDPQMHPKQKEKRNFGALKGLPNFFSLSQGDFQHELQSQEVVSKRTLPAKLETVKAEGSSNRSRYIPVQVKQEVRDRSGGTCEFVDPITQRRCESRYLLQFDHIHPFSWGGESDSSNLRILCSTHNQFLGKEMLRKGPLELFSD